MEKIYINKVFIAGCNLGEKWHIEESSYKIGDIIQEHKYLIAKVNKFNTIFIYTAPIELIDDPKYFEEYKENKNEKDLLIERISKFEKYIDNIKNLDPYIYCELFCIKKNVIEQLNKK